jgi:SAM-dependent MidA family methyltransferase
MSGLAERLAAGPVPFDELIAHLTRVYYERADIGRDFNTPPEFFPQLGGCFARLAESAYRQLEHPQRFVVFEVGGGNGTLALSFLLEARRLPVFFRALDYHLVEQSSKLADIQRQRLAHHGVAEKVSWHVADVTKFTFPPIETGMYIAMENDDDLPCKAIYKRGGSPHEVFVTIENGRTTELVGEPSAALIELIDEYPEWWAGIPPSSTCYLPVHLDSLRARERLVEKLDRGLLVTCDYGYSFRVDRFAPDATESFFNVFLGNQRLDFASVLFERVLELEGQANFTAEVDFDLLSLAGERAGFATSLIDLRDLLDGFGLRELAERALSTLHELGEIELARNYALRLANLIDTRWLCSIQQKGVRMPLRSGAGDLGAWLYALSTKYVSRAAARPR